MANLLKNDTAIFLQSGLAVLGWRQIMKTPHLFSSVALLAAISLSSCSDTEKTESNTESAPRSAENTAKPSEVPVVEVEKKTHESVINENLATLESMVDVISTIDSSTSAVFALPKLKSLGKKMLTIRQDMKELGMPDAATKTMLKEKFSEKLPAAKAKLAKAMAKLKEKHPKAGKLIDSAMKAMLSFK